MKEDWGTATYIAAYSNGRLSSGNLLHRPFKEGSFYTALRRRKVAGFFSVHARLRADKTHDYRGNEVFFSLHARRSCHHPSPARFVISF